MLTMLPFAPASPAEPLRVAAGIAELVRLGFRVADRAVFANDGYFSAALANRRHDFAAALERPEIDALVGVRGGYGSIRLVPEMLKWKTPKHAKLFIGLSDISSLHLFLNQKWGRSTLHAPLLDRVGLKKIEPRYERELKRVQRDGFAVDDEEFLPGLICLAVRVPAADRAENDEDEDQAGDH